MTKREAEERWRMVAQLEEMGLTRPQAEELRRASMTLHRWAELACGSGNDYASLAIVRDEETGKPYLVTYPHAGESYQRRVADREGGALRRIASILRPLGLHWYHQTDPRGCALYVSREPLTDADYNRGIAIG